MMSNFDSARQNNLALWYDKPAESWMTEAIPVGNAHMGAMVFGGPSCEQIQFTEETLFSGGPGSSEQYNFGHRPGAWKALPKIRELLDAGDFEQAHALTNAHLTGVIHEVEGNEFGDYGAQQPFGDLFIEVDDGSKKNEASHYTSHYIRGLNLSTGIAHVSYTNNGIKHQRELFGSYPRRCLIGRFTNTSVGGCQYKLRLKPAHPGCQAEFKDNCLIVSGCLPDNKMAFEARVMIRAEGAAVDYENDVVTVTAAKELIFSLTASTNYANVYPHYRGNNPAQNNQAVIASLEPKSYLELQEESVADYRNLFDRVSFTLGEQGNTSLPTDVRLQRYQDSRKDRGLEALYFNYGRYLLISSSRPGSMPCNLQGKWNKFHRPAWTNDFHMNINQQMIYWPAEAANLGEAHQPLLEYIKSLLIPGQQSAKDFFNARGWIVNTTNNPFGFTATGWELPWGLFPAAAAWLCQHLWEHFAYGQDKKWLKDTALPLMEEAALFWIDHLVENEEGMLISSPSYSPEHGGISRSAYMDLEIVYDLFLNLEEAYQVLNVESHLQRQIVAARSRIAPLKIGRWGQLQEWMEDIDDPECDHRHLSHLFALHPGRQVTLESTPGLAQAANTTLEKRGDQGTGWSLAWKINFWARLENGEKAHELMGNLLNYTQQEDMTYTCDGGTYPNLLCAHPPFQLDGSMGGTAGMIEMLMQSHNGLVKLLPACPAAWNRGRVTGIRARGGLDLDITWKEGALSEVVCRATSSNQFVIQYRSKKVELVLAEGEMLRLDGNLLRVS